MSGVIFSVTLSVSLAAALLFLLKGTIVRHYGFKMIYILSLIMAIRLIIPYSIQLPNKPKFNMLIPYYVPIIWAVGAVICMIFQAGKYIYLRRSILNRGKFVTDESILRQYESVKSELFIDDEIPLIMSAEVISPMLLGFFKPFIVLPMHSFSQSETEMVLRHEFIHYRNKDSFKKLFFAFVTAVQWFNPFVWLLMREFYGSLECMCDEAVTINSNKQYKKDYCYMLLKTGNRIGTSTVAATHFSTKDMLKMRIDNVFEGKKKKSGTTLITSFAVCLAVLSGFLCSCTIETPDNVKEEMSRIEQGMDNEKDANTGLNESSTTESAVDEISLIPVSEAVSTAQQTIEEWNSKDGIFKFDNCNVMIPQVAELPEYDVKFDVGVDTPKKKLTQFKEIEREVFGENTFDDDNFTIVPFNPYKADGTYEGELTLDEYIARGDSKAAIANGTDNTSLQHLYTRIWCTKPNYYNYIDLRMGTRVIAYENLVKEYNCITATAAELAEEYALPDGTTTIAEAMECAEEISKKYSFTNDENIKFKASSVKVYAVGDGTYVFEILVQIYYGEIPIVAMANNYNESDEINFPMESIIRDVSIIHMVRCTEADMFDVTCSNTSFTPTGNGVTKIISLDQAFELIKEELSDSVVYDVKSIQLGYDTYSEDEFGESGIKTMPLYNITLETTSNTIYVSIDAVTGNMNVKNERRKA